MPESVYCHACTATTTSEARYSNAGDRVCPACESDFVEVTETAAAQAQPTVRKPVYLLYKLRWCRLLQHCFIPLSISHTLLSVLQTDGRAARQHTANTGQRRGRNQGFHRHFTTPAGHNVHLHVVTSMGGIPAPLESLLNNAQPADLAALLQNMQGINLRPVNLPP